MSRRQGNMVISRQLCYAHTMIRLNGCDPTVKDGLYIATSKVGSILGYALIAATVDMILRAV